MTKKPSEKNKAWEKDRRDRLNKAFENLSKLLPNYDPSIIWTKNEIIQKSILHIVNLQDKYEKCLSSKDSITFSLHKDLTDAIQYFQCRNKQICDILKEKQINLPALNLPKFLIEHPQFNIESHAKNDTAKRSKSSKTSKKRNENKVVKPLSVSTAEFNSPKNEGENNNVQPITLQNKQQLQLCNSILLPIQQPLTPNLIQIANSTSTPLILNKNKNGKIFLLTKPEIKVYFSRSDGKIPIPVIKKYVPLPLKNRHRKKISMRKMKENQEFKINRKRTSSKKSTSKCDLIQNKRKCNQNTESETLKKNSSRSLSPTAAFLQSFPVVAQKSIDNDILCDLPSNASNNILIKSKDKSFENSINYDKKNKSESAIKLQTPNNLQSTNKIYQNITPISNELIVSSSAPVVHSFFTTSYTTSCNTAKTKLLNLSTQKPICTPLPLENKGEDVQNSIRSDSELFRSSNFQNNFKTNTGEQCIKADLNCSKPMIFSDYGIQNNSFETNTTLKLDMPNNCKISNKNTLLQNNKYIGNTATAASVSANNSELTRKDLLYTPHENNLPFNTTSMQNNCTGKSSSLSNQNKIKDTTSTTTMNLNNQTKKQTGTLESNESVTNVMEKLTQLDHNSLTKKSRESSDCLNYINDSNNLHSNNFNNNLYISSNPNSFNVQNNQKSTYMSYSDILCTPIQNNSKHGASKIVAPSHSSLCVQQSKVKVNESLKQNEDNILMQNQYVASEKNKMISTFAESIPKAGQPSLNTTSLNGNLEEFALIPNTKINKIFGQEKPSEYNLNNKNLGIEPKLNLSFSEEFKIDYSIESTTNNTKKYNREATGLINQNLLPPCNSKELMISSYKHTNNTSQSLGNTTVDNLNITSNSSLAIYPTFSGSSCNNKISAYQNIPTPLASQTTYPVSNNTTNETESIFPKNYYYPPVTVQPETTFSFNLNTSQQNYFHTSTNLFTFSLTPTTNTIVPSKLNEPIQNYTYPINQSCQSEATNFTFSLTTPITSITQSDSIHNTNINENCPKYFDQQFYQNNTTNFTFALTKTTETVSSHISKIGNDESSKISNKSKVNSHSLSQNKNEATYTNTNQFYYDCGQQNYLKAKDQCNDTQKGHGHWTTSSECNKKNENWNYKFSDPTKKPRSDYNFKVPNSIDSFNKNPKTIKTSQNPFSVSQLVHDCETYQTTSTNLSSQDHKKTSLIKDKKNSIPPDSFAEQKFYNYSAESLISKKDNHKINAAPNCNIGTDFYPQNSFTYNNNIDDPYSSNYLFYNQEEYQNNDITKSNKCHLNKKGQQSNFHQTVGSYDNGNYIPPPPPAALGSEYYSHNYYSNNNNIPSFNNNWNSHQSNEVNNSSGNLTNFYLSSICPEINEKNNSATNW